MKWKLLQTLWKRVCQCVVKGTGTVPLLGIHVKENPAQVQNKVIYKAAIFAKENKC